MISLYSVINASLFDQFRERIRRVNEGEGIQELTPPHEVPVDFRERSYVTNFRPEFLDRLDLVADELGGLVCVEQKERGRPKA